MLYGLPRHGMMKKWPLDARALNAEFYSNSAYRSALIEKHLNMTSFSAPPASVSMTHVIGD